MPDPYARFSLADHGRIPGRGHGHGRLRRRSGRFGGRRSWGRRGFRWSRRCGSGRFWRGCGGSGSCFRFRLNRSGGCSFHPARGRGLIRRRFRFTFRRRRRGGFDFVRHSLAKAQTSGAVCVAKRTLTFISLRGWCQRCQPPEFVKLRALAIHRRESPEICLPERSWREPRECKRSRRIPSEWQVGRSDLPPEREFKKPVYQPMNFSSNPAKFSGEL